MRSMTGFGRGSCSGDGFIVTVEVKSVNHRNLSLSMGLPDPFSHLEPGVRDAVGGVFSRGRIRVDARIEASEECASGLVLDTEAVRAYLAAAERLRTEFGSQGDVPVDFLLGLPGVMRRAETTDACEEELASAFDRALAQALEQLDSTRSREGSDLERFLREGLNSIGTLLEPVIGTQKRSAGKRYERLIQRVAEIASNVKLDPDRMAQELAILVDRSDVTEEVSRLRSHIDHALETISADSGPAGRRLEFIIQEMHRELNTMGAKVDDSGLAAEIVEMKSILATLKEQAANVE